MYNIINLFIDNVIFVRVVGSFKTWNKKLLFTERKSAKCDDTCITNFHNEQCL